MHGTVSRGKILLEYFRLDSDEAFLKLLQESRRNVSNSNYVFGSFRKESISCISLHGEKVEFRTVELLPNETFSLSNGFFHSEWPKEKFGKQLLDKSLCRDLDEEELVEVMFIVLENQQTFETDLPPNTEYNKLVEKSVSSIFLDRIEILKNNSIEPITFSTVSSTVLLIKSDGNVLISEKSWIPEKSTRTFDFKIT